MDKKNLRQYQRGNRDNKSKFLVILALGGAAVAVGLLSFVTYKQYFARGVKNRQYQKRHLPNEEDEESEEEEEEEEEYVQKDKEVQPPTKTSNANENKIKWWSEIATEQRTLNDIKSARFYAIKAIDEMNLDPKYENSLVMMEMKFILATTVRNEEEKEKLLSNLLSTMERLGEDVSDDKYYEIKGNIYKDMSDIYFTKEKYVEAKEFSQRCYENFKRGFSNHPNRLDSALAVAKYNTSTINEKLNLLEESEADAYEAYQHAMATKNFQLILHISNHRTNLLTKLNRFDDAIASIKELIEDTSFEKTPSFLANRHHLLASLLFNDLGKTEEAVEHLKEAITIFPNYFPAMSLLISCYYELNQEDEARKIADNLIKSYDLSLSQSKYFITSFMSFTSEKEGEPYIFFIQLKMKRDKNEELIIKPGSYIELNIRKFYKSDETRPEDESPVAEVQKYSIVGNEEDDIISLGSDLIGEHDDSAWYEMIVKVYEDESKENQIGIHYQLITTTVATLKQYEKMQKWLEQRKEAQKLEAQKEEQENEENVENIVADEGDENKEEIPTEGIFEETKQEKNVSAEEQPSEENIEEILTEEQSKETEDEVEIPTEGIVENEQSTENITTEEEQHQEETSDEVQHTENQTETVTVEEQHVDEETKETQTEEQISEEQVEEQKVEVEVQQSSEEQPEESKESQTEEQTSEEHVEEQRVEVEVQQPFLEESKESQTEEQISEEQVEEQKVEIEVQQSSDEQPEESKETQTEEQVEKHHEEEETQNEESQQEVIEEEQPKETEDEVEIPTEGIVENEQSIEDLDDLVGDVDEIDYSVEGHVNE